MARHIALRPATDADIGFLRNVYASTRADELAAVDWTEEVEQQFLDMQFEAQHRYYREYYPSATFDVVLIDGEAAGRLYVDRWAEEIRIVDIAVLPEHRGRGVGTMLLHRLMDEAAATGTKLSIHVEIFNRALELYRRLGFAVAFDKGVHLLMEWRPGSGDDGFVAHPVVIGAERDEEERELTQLGVADRAGLLPDEVAARRMEEQRERDASNGFLPLGRVSVGTLLAGGEHEVEPLAVSGRGSEHLAHEAGEGRAGELLEHRPQDRHDGFPEPRTEAVQAAGGHRGHLSP
jgi:ribosomal protein S18 acetylase RimI-like enzyme